MARSVRGGGRLDTGLLLASLLLSIVAIIMPQRFRDAASSALRATMVRPLVALEGRATQIRATLGAREALLATRARAVTDTLGVRAVSDENITLRRLLGLSARLADGFVVAEVLPKRGVDDDFTLTLNVGANAGVEAFAPVVTADGLVGMVEKVDSATSFAMTWANPSFRVSAMSVDETAFGIVQPHLGEDVERLMLELRGVPFRAKLDSGALVVSSGLGARYPRGIPVGIVIGELSTPEKWARTYLLMPAVLPASIGPVVVLRTERGRRGVNTVWTNVASADSAARAVAAAGDSIARIAALAELAARRAAIEAEIIDSLARDSALAIPPLIRSPLTGADSARADSIRRARADSIRARPTLPPVRPPVVRTGPPPELEPAW
ncbi:MAG: rod shape-determining protein MreC [Gemmatimonadaceae bacterium]|nr:rod shape-determining protein MreC [Gemmatimonadaceae bacterium]